MTKRMTRQQIEQYLSTVTEKQLQQNLETHGDAAGLVFLEGYGWWLKNKPYPPANYYPPDCVDQLQPPSDAQH